MQHVNIFHISTIHNDFYKPTEEKKSREVKSCEWGAREWAPLFLSSDQVIYSPERNEHNVRSGAKRHATGKLFPQEHDPKQNPPS
jgi:hypothetical protein